MPTPFNPWNPLHWLQVVGFAAYIIAFAAALVAADLAGIVWGFVSRPFRKDST